MNDRDEDRPLPFAYLQQVGVSRVADAPAAGEPRSAGSIWGWARNLLGLGRASGRRDAAPELSKPAEDKVALQNKDRPDGRNTIDGAEVDR